MKKFGGLKDKVHLKTDVKINLAAIIDCMVVILAYLLLSGSFLSLGVIESNYKSTSQEKAPPSDSLENAESLENGITEVLIVDIHKDSNISIYSTNSDFKSIEISAIENNKMDFEKYLTELKSSKENFPHIKMVSVRPHKGLFYKDFIKTLESTKVFYSDVWMDQ